MELPATMSSFALSRCAKAATTGGTWGRGDLFDLHVPGAAHHGEKLRQELKPGRNLDTESEAEERRLLTGYSRLARFVFLSTLGLLVYGCPQWTEASHSRH